MLLLLFAIDTQVCFALLVVESKKSKSHGRVVVMCAVKGMDRGSDISKYPRQCKKQKVFVLG